MFVVAKGDDPLSTCDCRDEREYEMEIRRAELNTERQQLMTMQQHLLKLHESLAAATSAATAQVFSSLPH